MLGGCGALAVELADSSEEEGEEFLNTSSQTHEQHKKAISFTACELLVGDAVRFEDKTSSTGGCHGTPSLLNEFMSYARLHCCITAVQPYSCTHVQYSNCSTRTLDRVLLESLVCR